MDWSGHARFSNRGKRETVFWHLESRTIKDKAGAGSASLGVWR